MTAGVYTYTVTGVAPCANASATVTVAETSSPDAGADANVALCSSSGSLDLFAQLGGTPDVGGTWSGPSVLVGSSFDPATMAEGIYTYTLSGTAPCASATATVTVTVEVAPDAGLPGSIQLCPGSATVDLFTLLGGSPQAGGTWTGPGGGAFDGIFDPGSDTAGDHTYTITGTVCITASAVVAVTVLPGPDAGDDGVISVCSTQAGFALVSQLGGTPDAGGAWTNAQGVGVPATFDPATGTSNTFTYTVNGSANCPDDQATLAITVNIAPQAGTDGSLTLCASSPAVSLFDGLGGTLDAGGAWTGPDAQPHGTILDPATDVSGIYTYTVSGIAPCVDASATVNVTINPVPYAGEDGQLIICTSAPAVNLSTLLGGVPQSGGTWSDPDGQPSNGSFAPSTGTEGVYTYTIAGIAPCVNDFSTVTVTTSIAGNAGGDASITLCFDGPGVDLFTQLTGQPDANGTWTAPDGAPSAGFVDPASAPEGAYTYTVTPPTPCPAVSAVVDVGVIEPVVTTFLAESDGSCAPLEVSFSHGYTGPGICTWILGNGDIVQDCAPFTATYSDPGSYDVTLIIDAGNICGADTVTIEDAVLVYTQPVADFEMVPPNINTLDPLAYLNNTSAGANAYVWTIDDAFTSTDEDVRYLFSAELGTEHVICLVAIAAASCTDTLCKVLTVEDGLSVYVPNTFTPDNNEVNETFKPIVAGIDPRFYLFEIYDRWGLRLFSTTDPEAFWDGTLGGEQAPQDVYVWKLIAKDAYSGDRLERIGHVTLLR